ncbi:DUF2501 domain-containing protein [Massilia solisilvae]|uniref:DUF2501 domain-containing protein n=1 Tax=Massilia solisilvae TaxID=1811225 RepID=A0ABT2BQ02_9BURK|nr:DUF2501 domain-containing protein [Massilia solisilvae]MCS0610592.1 DUF2501 domain-containing protein [Massilia solisilvae]
MKTTLYRIAALLLALPLASAHAQLEGLMGKGGKDLQGLAGALPGQSMNSGSLGNVAGLLQFCVTNNYLGGGDVNSVQDKLMGKLPGGTKSQDPGFTDGLKGVLHGSNGKQVDLSSTGGIKEQVTKQVCDTVLKQARSFL